MLTLCSCHADTVLGKSNDLYNHYESQGRSEQLMLNQVRHALAAKRGRS